ncbi:MAG: hypothetical protein ACO1SX_00830 [Actinomycetota bacterium]
MAERTFPVVTLAVAAALCGVSAVHAEKLPEPTGVLRDYDGRGTIQITIPPRGEISLENGQKAVDPGFSTWFAFRQMFVSPGRILMVHNLGNALQATLVQDNVERTYIPTAGSVIERNYKNLDKAEENPINTVQMAMATYAKVLRELDSGKLLPDENLDQIKERDTKRLAELTALRAKLMENKRPEDEVQAQSAAAESAVVRDNLDQLDLRRAHPCHVIEFLNRDLMRHLFTRGLMGESMGEILAKGKTTFWVTKAEGLPVKVETTANDGSVAVMMLFKELKINSGLHPGEVVLGHPQGTMTFRAVVDLREKDWEQRMQNDINDQIGRYEKATRQAGPPALTPVFPKNKKKR